MNLVAQKRLGHWREKGPERAGVQVRRSGLSEVDLVMTSATALAMKKEGNGYSCKCP